MYDVLQEYYTLLLDFYLLSKAKSMISYNTMSASELIMIQDSMSKGFVSAIFHKHSCKFTQWI